MTIHDSRGHWPFPLVTQIRHDGAPDWVEISDRHHDEFLCVLPPIYCPGGFLVSEPAAHVTVDGTDVPVYSAVMTVNGRRFMREMTKEAAHAEYAQLRLFLATNPSAGART